MQVPKKEEQQEEDIYVWNQRFPREPNMTMEGIKGLGGEGRVGVEEEDIGDSMQCNDHAAYRNNPGGICPFCLQEKLGKLVSSSFSLPIRSSSSSSPSPFKSDIGNRGAGSSSSSPSLSVRPTLTKVIYDGGCKDGHYHEYYRRRARILFLLGKKKIKKKKKVTTVAASDRAANMIFKRSKYTATPGRKQLSGGDDNGEHVIPKKRGGFWSFLYPSSSSSSTATTASSSSKSAASKSMDKSFRNGSKITTLKVAEATNGSVGKHKKKRRPGSSLGEKTDTAEDDDDDGSNSQATASASSLERKVWRSRSVECGSRSFSGDLFERISAGFGDCTLRRVESQGEGKSKVSASAEIRSGSSSGHQQKFMKERGKCGGIFAGFMRI